MPRLTRSMEQDITQCNISLLRYRVCLSLFDDSDSNKNTITKEEEGDGNTIWKIVCTLSLESATPKVNSNSNPV